MKDLQKELDKRNIFIDKVGISNFKIPLIVGYDKNTVANISLSVSLAENKRAIHMSRLIEVISSWDKKLSYHQIRKIMNDTKLKLETDNVFLEIQFEYFKDKISPVSKLVAPISYDCKIISSLNKDNLIVELNIPIASVCPCSKEISQFGAHNQRGIVTIEYKTKELSSIDKVISLVEDSSSHELYSLLKRTDEKYITEYGYNNAKFVEDIIRDITINLYENGLYDAKIKIKNFESIHSHNAIAELLVNENSYMKYKIKKQIYDELKSRSIDVSNIDDKELVETHMLSSLSLIQIITNLEEIVGDLIITDDTDIAKLTTVKNICKYAYNAYISR